MNEWSTWLNRGEQLAKRYWQKLFKEYCICDLSRYKENKACLLLDASSFISDVL